MNNFRKFFRRLACAVILIIIAFSGHNIAIRYLYPVKYSETIAKYSELYGVDRDLAFAVIDTESGFRKDVRSSAGACGLMQLTEETFLDMRDIAGDSTDITFDDVFSPEINIKYGIRYMKYLEVMFPDDRIAMLAAYNAGPTNVQKWLGEDGKLSKDEIRFAETLKYIEKVIKAEKHYKRYNKGE